MTQTPPWWADLLGVSDILAKEDNEFVAEWQDGDGVPECDGAVVDMPPLTVRLGLLARAFTRQATRFSQGQRRHMFDALERVLADGTEEEKNAVATGFFDALLAEADEGFDLRAVCTDVGPESRKYCIEWNAFTGVASPDWMLRTN